jgi:hypothetical protein
VQSFLRTKVETNCGAGRDRRQGQVKLQKNELSVVQLTSKVLITSWKYYDAKTMEKVSYVLKWTEREEKRLKVRGCLGLSTCGGIT